MLFLEGGGSSAAASSDVLDRLAVLRSSLPRGVTVSSTQYLPEAFRDSDRLAILQLVGPMPLEYLERTADRQVVRTLSKLSGIANLEIVGGRREEVRATLSREDVANGLLTAGALGSDIQQRTYEPWCGEVTARSFSGPLERH